MNFELSQTQLDFKSSLSEFVKREISPHARDLEHSGEYPEKIVAGLKQLGLFGITVPVDFGGLGLDSVSLAIVFEEISKGWMGAAGLIGTHSVACEMISNFGTLAQKESWLEKLAAGTYRSCLALTEPGAGSDLQGISTRGEIYNDEVVITGTKTWITNARRSELIPVLLKTDPNATPRHRGMSIVIVPRDTPGLTISRDLGKLGYKGPETCEIVLDGCRVPVDNILGGEPGRGMIQALSALQLGRINVAARGIGISQSALDKAIEYASQREAFGKPINQFQAVQCKLADMAISIQASRLLTYWAACEYDKSREAFLDRTDSSSEPGQVPSHKKYRADMHTAMAKILSSETALVSSLEAMRIHGAYGYSTELEIERLYRDAPLLAIGEGTNDILRLVIAKGLTGK